MDTETAIQLEQALRAQAVACRALADQLDKQAERLQPPEPAQESPLPDALQPLHSVYPGISKHRLHPKAGNPGEVAFARAWLADMHVQHTRLDWLLNPGTTRPTRVSLPYERAIAATIIQWLGSPVGTGFLIDVVASCPQLKAQFQHAFLYAEKTTP